MLTKAVSDGILINRCNNSVTNLTFYETNLEAHYLMFNRKVKLSAWILSAAVAFSTMTMPVSAASVLPSVGVGSSLTVTDSSLVTASNAEIPATSGSTAKASDKKSDVFKGAGVETAAGGIAVTKSGQSQKETKPLQEITTDASVAAAATSQADADASLVQTVAEPADTTAAAATTEEVTTVAVPEEIAAQPQDVTVQSVEINGQTMTGSLPTEAAGKIVSGADAAAESAKEQYKNLVIAKCNDYVNVRKEPSEEAEILGKLYNESVGDFVSEAEGGWVEIISGTVRGYVKAEYVVTGDAAVERAKEVGKRIATVNTTTLYVREQPTTDSSVVGMVPIEDDLSVLEEAEEGWVKVSVEEGEGYVSSDFVTLKTEFTKAESKEEEAARLAKEKAEREAALAAANKKSGKKGSKGSSDSGKSYASAGSASGSAVANYALQFVGNPYVYGGSSLTNGTDCSGFVMSVYAAFGVGLPHSSGAQRSCGTDVGGLGNAQPGDIVCYSGHVGIYIGGGQIVHASTAKTGIKVSNAGYRSVLSVRRIF